MIIEAKIQNIDAIGQDMVDTYRQWDRFERRWKSGVTVKDFDLSPRVEKYPPYILNRDDALVRFGEVLNNLPLLEKSDAREYLGAKAFSSIAYIIALEKAKRGEEPMSLDTYLKATMGIVPQWVLPREKNEQFSKVESLFKELGFSYDPQGWSNFYQTYHLNRKQASEEFSSAQQKLIPVLLDILGDPALEIPYKTKNVNEDVPWINWTSGDWQKGFLLRINYHARHDHRRVAGTQGMLVFHELGAHLGEAAVLKRNIDNGVINEGYGVTTIPGPEQWGLEGLAVSLPFMAPPLLEKFTGRERLLLQLAFELRYLTLLEYNNVHIELNRSHRRSDLELQEEVKYYLPWEEPVNMAKQFRIRLQDPYNRSYQMAYQDGTRFFRKIAKDLTDVEKNEIMKKLYEMPRTPRQILALVEEVQTRFSQKAS